MQQHVEYHNVRMKHHARAALQDNLHYVQTQDKDAVDKAAANFLEFLKEGRSVILQDAAILQDPAHRIFKLPCFRLPAEGHPASPLQQAWTAYKAEVLAAHARTIADNLQVICSHLPFTACTSVDKLHLQRQA